MSRIAIIPARGGSKRIPKKNVKFFLGQPIIAYSIKSAIESNLFDEVMVSTDDEEIKEIALSYGAKVPFFRSEKNSDDYATTIDVISEVLDKYSEKSMFFSEACCIYPCAPFVTAKKIIESHKSLIKYGYDCVFPVVKFGFPIQRAVRINEKRKISMFQEEYMQTRSQDLEESYHDAGQFYFFQTQKILEAKALWTDNTGSVVLSELESQDIDNQVDWDLAELKFNYINNK